MGFFGRKPTEHDARLALTQKEREREFSGYGDLGQSVLTRGLLPSFVTGTPPWPSTTMPSLRVLQDGNRCTVITNGLADPFDPATHGVEGKIGCGIEIYAATDSTLYPRSGALESWLHPLAQIAFAAGDWEAAENKMRSMLVQFDAITIQVPAPDEWKREQLDTGLVGVLLYSPDAAKIPMVMELTAGKVLLVAAKVLTPDEYERGVEHGNDGGIMLADTFAERGSHHLSWPGRPSVFATRA